jgi:hypothetical protein
MRLEENSRVSAAINGKGQLRLSITHEKGVRK